jgi:hypothetical protein
VEEEGFAVLAAEVLVCLLACGKVRGELHGVRARAYAADNVVVVGEMRLAVLAAVDLGSRQVGVVGETHRCGCFVVTLKRFSVGQGLAS